MRDVDPEVLEVFAEAHRLHYDAVVAAFLRRMDRVFETSRAKQAGYTREHYINNRDKCKAQAVAWLRDNPEKRKEIARRYYHNHIERKRQLAREYAARHREQRAAWKRMDRARKKGRDK